MKTKYKIQIAKTISFFLKLFYKKNQVHKRDGIKWSLDLNEGIDLSIFLFGTSEKKIRNLKYLFKSDSKLTIIDIGANIGSISLPLAKIFNKSKIFAIEPTNYAFKKLNRECKCMVFASTKNSSRQSKRMDWKCQRRRCC